jgi:hypothetical protein
VGTTLRVVASDAPEELLVPTERFEAPIGVPRATSVTYVCVDRAAYMMLADMPMDQRIAGSAVDNPSQDCLDVARRAGLSLEDQQAQQATDDGDGAEDGA